MQKHHKATIFALSLVILIDSLTIGLVIPLFAALFNDPHGIMGATATMGERNFWYSMIFSLPMFAMLFGAPILGELSDRFGRKNILMFSLIGIVLSCLLSVVSLYMDSVLVLLISRIFVGLLDSSQAIAQAAILDISEGDEKVTNLSIISFAGVIGWIIGPVLGGVLSDPHIVSWFSYETPFWVASFLALINIIWLTVAFKEISSLHHKPEQEWYTVILYLFKNFVDRRIVLLSIGFVTMQFAWAAVFQISNLLLAEKFHYMAAKLGLFSTCIALTFALVMLGGTKFLLRYFAITHLVKIGLFIVFAGMICMTFFNQDEIGLWLGVMPVIVGIAISYNTLITLFSNAVEKHEQGKVMGIVTSLVAIAWLLAGVYSGIMTSIDYTLTFAGLSVVSLAGCITILFYKEKEKHT